MLLPIALVGKVIAGILIVLILAAIGLFRLLRR